MMKALHLACGHTNARCDVIRMLLHVNAERLHAEEWSSGDQNEVPFLHHNELIHIRAHSYGFDIIIGSM